MLSVIVPCFNEEAGLVECHRQLSGVLVAMETPYEIVYVNDGSQDRTYALLKELHAQDSHAVVVQLSRNFGHQLAVSAGLETVIGDATVIIDADLQDPPQLIPQMYRLWQEGAHVVYGMRTDREGESSFKLWSARVFYRVINRLSDVQIPLDTGDFRLIDRKVVDVMLQMPERHRLLRAMCSWVGFRQVPLAYKRAARFAGETKYPLSKMLNLGMDGIVSFSTVPLRLVVLVGFGTAMFALLGIVYAFCVRLLTSHWVAGWSTLFIGMLFLSGVQMISLGVIGEYLGRVYTEVKQRPLFVIAHVLRAGSPSAMLEHSFVGRAEGRDRA
ncbi:glycosyltransferase family 2 protein [Acidipila sp. EB88]|uniref:glycosyltransferase family 2 protein n=1 Tax=Acidipila sp. EB88 TaxID=2305226 RepID=UPI000F5D7510|nr:glycosyltransferase family 2 protein [Acidipila sp. EB88]RRA47909.1 glycosyltransferase [Acidipila sp. EB88]